MAFLALGFVGLFVTPNSLPNSNMATAFSSLPIVDLSAISNHSPSRESLAALSQQLHDVFATTGFAYLVNSPLSFTHDDVFSLAREFFSIDPVQKMKTARKMFVQSNKNTYRGYFPPQPGLEDNLKEGFEIGPVADLPKSAFGKMQKFHLTEPNVWPHSAFSEGRLKLERLHRELQSLSAMLLSLLAVSLGKSEDYFSSYLHDSLSTLRLLHYPPQQYGPSDDGVRVCCTPHTDSGILTLLHQDATGGLEALNARGDWVPCPYVPGSIVVNIGDLMARVSGGRFVATYHRVRAPAASKTDVDDGTGRFSVPFFFEPGEACLVRGNDGDPGVVYGDHVRNKMGMFIEFQDIQDGVAKKISDETVSASGVALEAF